MMVDPLVPCSPCLPSACSLRLRPLLACMGPQVTTKRCQSEEKTEKKRRCKDRANAPNRNEFSRRSSSHFSDFVIVSCLSISYKEVKRYSPLPVTRYLQKKDIDIYTYRPTPNDGGITSKGECDNLKKKCDDLKKKKCSHSLYLLYKIKIK